ncbi:ABC transporter substrate-binding protein [Larsenimonas rhizosphaerae]|uniref:ABC transporter substrate-binding protein n=1 Tax=Larsenimonas rhizosphaerae TaxID=2944682 RepID=A0AA41ZF54_9GAMM|nr:ABC transporter substrate-binding protein [Larsenimonas rhizosphaerae]MCM2129438.1 ABC transporter substrate-binding protein [Larsenimonas rhizosphaerae]MCX2524094.1 ABC transporter substrate-binding protein [Larsenimonas rhizosphaerae]
MTSRIITALVLWALSTAAFAQERITVHDIAGRDVSVEVPVKRMILGEGRMIYALAMLDREAPFKRVVGWRDDLAKADPGSWEAYKKRYPEITKIPTFGGFKEGTFDVEQAITLDPQVVVMNIEAREATESSGLDRKLAAVGIPVVYIDFREKPMQHTDPSLRLLGRLTDHSKRADEFIEFSNAHIKAVTDRLAKSSPTTPEVFIERAAGYSEECCMSFGNANFGEMVTLAGGHNIAGDIIPGTFGTVNPEQVIASDPSVYIATGGEWSGYVPDGKWIPAGPNSDQAEARKRLEYLLTRPALAHTEAVKQGNVHAIWHQFYNSPYQFVAIEQLAKWIHPDLFRDVDPDATLRELYSRFLPLEYAPGYFTSLNKDEDA